MKITDEMIEAASSAYALHPQNSESVALKEPIRAAIEAALRVRKAAKRELKRETRKYDQYLANRRKGNLEGGLNGLFPLPPSTPKPTWDGRFEVGKSYRTRDGREAIILGVKEGRWVGLVLQNVTYARWAWHLDGLLFQNEKNGVDLIAPWEQP